MTALTLVNSTSDADGTAEFRVFQGNHQVARLGIHSQGSASIPTTTSYAAQATTTSGDFTLTSNPVYFDSTSVALVAAIVSAEGFVDFRLSEEPGVHPSTITLRNIYQLPVQFKLQQPNTPFEIVAVVDGDSEGEISTAQQWQVYAIINGITTGTVTVNDPNATITATADNNDAGYSLGVS